MLRFTSGNLFEADVEALVNTVNTVGVMGKGIALMFKEAFPENFKAYELASKHKEISIGHMFVTHTGGLYGPKWIINFPTKQHWRNPSKLRWIYDGLTDLKNVIRKNNIHSVAIPPLGAGNGGLEWARVRSLIEESLAELSDVEIIIYEPTDKYQNVQKRSGVQQLTPARALIAEAIRRYWVLGIECTILEVQKLAWFIEMSSIDLEIDAPLKLNFSANLYGPYADNLRHLLNNLDGSYLHCEKRLSDAGPLDVIWFDDAKREVLDLYLKTSDAKGYKVALDATTRIIDGFESPLGMELLATVDWLLRNGVAASAEEMGKAIGAWPGGEGAAQRKSRIFDQRLLMLALERLTTSSKSAGPFDLVN